MSASVRLFGDGRALPHSRLHQVPNLGLIFFSRQRSHSPGMESSLKEPNYLYLVLGGHGGALKTCLGRE
ncbi:hypothetical protein PoB_000170000 [Plakobranchus ocellatus]|uniref:Uncharacterized protein n=1 Tax=Plakobranchus ocellatus TaxID=259542 RepID=A0AAV3XX34_9GAST|nr:hypothetical protein PoB_000170000 [Plakobranchus ocellatus]